MRRASGQPSNRPSRRVSALAVADIPHISTHAGKIRLIVLPNWRKSLRFAREVQKGRQGWPGRVKGCPVVGRLSNDGNVRSGRHRQDARQARVVGDFDLPTEGPETRAYIEGESVRMIQGAGVHPEAPDGVGPGAIDGGVHEQAAGTSGLAFASSRRRTAARIPHRSRKSSSSRPSSRPLRGERKDLDLGSRIIASRASVGHLSRENHSQSSAPTRAYRSRYQATSG